MRRAIIPYIVIALLIAAGVWMVFHQSRLRPSTYTFNVMGTYARIIVVDKTEGLRREAGHRAHGWIVNTQNTANTYDPSSDISKLSNLPPDTPTGIGDIPKDVLVKSIAYYKFTGGAFDITVAPLMDLWRAAARNDVPPTSAEIAIALQSVGSDKITLGDGSRTPMKAAPRPTPPSMALFPSISTPITFSRPGMSLTLDAIVKGYAADRALTAIRYGSATAALVDIGGDIVCFGHPPDQDAWHIGIQNPFQPATSPMDKSPGSRLATIALTDAAVATSGNYERTFKIQGKSYSQIIDPRTGYPVTQAPSVTIIAPTAADADALATACSVLTVPQALDLINSIPRTEALLITGSPDDPTFHTSDGFKDYLLTPLPD